MRLRRLIFPETDTSPGAGVWRNWSLDGWSMPRLGSPDFRFSGKTRRFHAGWSLTSCFSIGYP